MAEKAKFSVGVFGIPAKIVNGVIRIKVNVRMDQDRQRKAAGLPEDSPIFLVDCPGGGVMTDDESMESALQREVFEETGGCEFIDCDGWQEPLVLLNREKGQYDIAFWKPIRLAGEPKPSSEASDHPWLSIEDLQSGDKYRPVSGLGLKGRTGQMMLGAIQWFKNAPGGSRYFS